MDLLGRYSKRAGWATALPASTNVTVGRPGAPGPPSRLSLKQLPPAQAEALAQDYLDGATVYELARRYGINRNAVSHHLHRLSVPMRRQGLSAEQRRLAAQLYQQGQSLARIGNRLVVDPTMVRAALLAQGIPTRDPQGSPR